MPNPCSQFEVMAMQQLEQTFRSKPHRFQTVTGNDVGTGSLSEKQSEKNCPVKVSQTTGRIDG